MIEQFLINGWFDITLKGAGANFSFRNFKPDFLHQYLLKLYFVTRFHLSDFLFKF